MRGSETNWPQHLLYLIYNRQFPFSLVIFLLLLQHFNNFPFPVKKNHTNLKHIYIIWLLSSHTDVDFLNTMYFIEGIIVCVCLLLLQYVWTFMLKSDWYAICPLWFCAQKPWSHILCTLYTIHTLKIPLFCCMVVVVVVVVATVRHSNVENQYNNRCHIVFYWIKRIPLSFFVFFFF